MRGKHPVAEEAERALGITPADAGKTQFAANPANMCQDHPRGCGENDLSCCNIDIMLGSPPRMRGKPCISTVAASSAGITPTDAGKTARLYQLRDST